MTREHTLPHEVPLTVCVAQLGARMHYAVPRILYAAGMLESFYTDFIAVRPWPALLGALEAVSGANGTLGRMHARVPDGIPPTKVTHWPAFAIEYYVRQRRAATPAELRAVYLWAGTEFCQRIIRHGLGRASGVYTYNSAGLELLEHARRQGLFRVMEQTIAPCAVEDRLLAEEQRAWPGCGIPSQADAHRAALAARERAEWECADLIVCGSEFVRRGIAECGGPAARCAVVPYGADAPRVSERQQPRQEGRLHVLLAGGVGLRKGAPYALAAARALQGVAEFRWAGPVALLPAAASTLSAHIDLRGAVSRTAMPAEYAWADVFLLPTICEGSATVCYEALAARLPVITTPNAGSVIRDGVDGFIVPIRNSEAIVERLTLLAHDQDLRRWMSNNARARAREFSVEKYGERLIATIQAACAACEGTPNTCEGTREASHCGHF
jgi:hypothetical protein